LEELDHRAEAPRLPRLGKIGREARHRYALGNGGHERRDLGQRHRRKLRQGLVRRQLERFAGEVDHRLIRHGALDLVAVGREHAELARGAIAGELLHEPGLADAGLALEQHDMARAGGEACEQSDQQAELGAAAYERGRFCRTWPRGTWLGGTYWNPVYLQPLRSPDRTRRVEEGLTLLRRDAELFGQAFGEAPRRLALVGLDLADGEARAAHRVGERLL